MTPDQFYKSYHSWGKEWERRSEEVQSHRSPKIVGLLKQRRWGTSFGQGTVRGRGCWEPGAGQVLGQVPSSWGNVSAVSLHENLPRFISLVKPEPDTSPITWEHPLWRMQVWVFLSCFVACYCIKLRNQCRKDTCMYDTGITAAVLSSALYCEYRLFFCNVLQVKAQSCVILPCQAKTGADSASHPIQLRDCQVALKKEGIVFGGERTCCNREIVANGST